MLKGLLQDEDPRVINVLFWVYKTVLIFCA